MKFGTTDGSVCVCVCVCVIQLNHPIVKKGTSSRKYKLIRAALRGESRDVVDVVEGGHPFSLHSLVLAGL